MRRGAVPGLFEFVLGESNLGSTVTCQALSRNVLVSGKAEVDQGNHLIHNKLEVESSIPAISPVISINLYTRSGSRDGHARCESRMAVGICAPFRLLTRDLYVVMLKTYAQRRRNLDIEVKPENRRNFRISA